MSMKIAFTLMLSLSLSLFAIENAKDENLPPLHFELYKPNASSGGESINAYRLYVTDNFEPGNGLLMIRRIDGSFLDNPVYIENDGSLKSFDKHQDLIQAFGGAYGERFEIMLVAMKGFDDYRPIAKCVIVPYPLIAENNGRRIELQAESPNGKSFTIIGTGFSKNEKIHFKSRSCNEKMEYDLKADENGEFYFGYNPAVIGKSAGPFEVTFSTNDMKPVKIRHYWGKIAFTSPADYKKLTAKYKFPDE